MAKKAQPEIVEEIGKLNEVIIREEKRPDGSLRYALDYSNCPTLTEQHTAHLSDLNYLMEKYKPDELAAYLAARNQYRMEILGHDFAAEPSLQDAKNTLYEIKQIFESLPADVKAQFQSPFQFMKFIDNEKNKETLVRLGLVKADEIPDIGKHPVEKPVEIPKT